MRSSFYFFSSFISPPQFFFNLFCNFSFWLGSQQSPGPIYQYRLILPFDDRLINVATDANFNIEGEVKTPLMKNVNAKFSFQVGEQNNMLSADVDWSGKSHTALAQFLKQSASSSSYMLTFMQALTPSLSMGGMAQYHTDKGTLNTGYGGIYDSGDNLIGAQWDSNVSLVIHVIEGRNTLRKVSPSRSTIRMALGLSLCYKEALYAVFFI